jgi:hypothetical protein
MPRPYASGVVAHGWNIDEESLIGCSKLVRLRLLLRAGGVCGAGTWRVVWVGVRQAHCWVLRQPAAGSGLHGWCSFLRVRAVLVGAGSRGCRVFLEVRVTGSHPDQPACRCWWLRVAWWVRPLLENCIVDASIFEFFQDCDREAYGHGLLVCGCCFVVCSWFL